MSKKKELKKKYAGKLDSISLDDELIALDTIDAIQIFACTDASACQRTGMGVYKFWLTRIKCDEIAKIYQLASDARAQSSIDKAIDDISELEENIKSACTSDGRILDKAQMHALVALSRTKYTATIRYAQMTDAKRWSEKIQISGDGSIDIATIVSEARIKREQIRDQLRNE